jgi:hypothetical protein
VFRVAVAYLSGAWLPAPKGGFRFTARFYGAATPLINASYEWCAFTSRVPKSSIEAGPFPKL